MTTKSPAASTVPTYSVSNCTITNNTSANEHTRAAVESLANAAAENARAIAAIARALEGGGAHMDCAIRLGTK